MICKVDEEDEGIEVTISGGNGGGDEVEVEEVRKLHLTGKEKIYVYRVSQNYIQSA